MLTMDKDVMHNRYMWLYNDMATSSEPYKMKVFGEAEKWAFSKTLESHPELAEKWLGKLESSVWYNYITESEYEEMSAYLTSQDGRSGPNWTVDDIRSVAQVPEEAPYYNLYALALTMNMLYSDHEKSVSMYVDSDNQVRFFYCMAVEKLKDPDRKRFIRPYFSL